MGNFSVSHYARIEARSGGAVQIRYVLDLAELPSFELQQQWKLKQDAPEAELRKRAAASMEEWVANGLVVRANGALMQPRVVSTDFFKAEGAGALPVYRIGAILELPDAKPGVLEYEDRNFPERDGWKEIVITGDALVKASHDAIDRSQGLTAYVSEDPAAASADSRARVEWAALPQPAAALVIEPIPQPVSAVGGQSSAGPPAAASQGKRDRLTDLVSQENLSGFPLIVAFLLAFGFGCAHALTPGHGKTMVAAYLVGERGTPKHAILLGLTTTVTHTVSVFALGVAMYFLAGSFAPDRVTRILELISGASIALLGAWLLYRRALQLRNIDPDLAHGHTHEPPPIPENGGEVSLASLLALGASGGLVPCPSALVLLLSSIALGRVGLGLFLLISFSLGLASVLVGIGLAVLYAKNFLPERASSSAWLRYTPVLSACFIIAVGVFLTGTALLPR